MDPDSTTFLLLALFTAALIHSIFTALSVSITVSSERKLRELPNHANFVAARAVRRRAPYYLNSCHVALLVSAAALGGVLALLTVELYGHARELLPEGGTLGAGIGAGAAGFLLLLLAGGFSQGARMVAFVFPERALLALARTALLAGRLLDPLVSLIHLVPRRLARLLARFGSLSGQSDDANRPLSEQAEEEMHADERDMIEGVFLLSDTVVREVMTPRGDIVSVPESATLDELLHVFQTEKLSRLLVTAGASLDHVRGVLHLKDLLPYLAPHERARFDMRKVMRPPFFVSDEKSVSEVLREFRKRATHIAVVLDEHGGVDGLLTVEDLLEEIVGDIFDEFDSPAQEISVRRTRGGDLIVQGSCLIDDLNADYPFDLPRGEYDTLAGFVIHELGRIPEPGEVVQHGNLKLTVEEVEDNRIVAVRLSRGRLALAASARSEHPPGGSGEGGGEDRLGALARR